MPQSYVTGMIAAAVAMPRRLAVIAVFLAVLTPVATVIAMTPNPTYRDVRTVGVLCRLDRATDAPAMALDADGLCREAVSILSRLLGDTPPVVALHVNDERLAEPDRLTVLVHAGLAVPPAGAGGGGLLTVAVRPFRFDRPDNSLFVTAPVAAVLGDGDTATLASLLGGPLAGVVRPFLGLPRPTGPVPPSAPQ